MIKLKELSSMEWGNLGKASNGSLETLVRLFESEDWWRDSYIRGHKHTDRQEQEIRKLLDSVIAKGFDQSDAQKLIVWLKDLCN